MLTDLLMLLPGDGADEIGPGPCAQLSQTSLRFVSVVAKEVTPTGDDRRSLQSAHG